MVKELLCTLALSSNISLPASVYPLYAKKVNVSSQNGRYLSPPYEEFESYIFAVIQVESYGKADATSPVGAAGLMQVMGPAIVDAATFCGVPVTMNPYNPEANIVYGSCYLHLLYQKTGNWTDTLVVYNGGYRGLRYWKRTGKMFKETENYVRKVREICQ